jgi:hypothetical protein
VDVGIQIAERLHFEMLHQFPRPFDAVENRGDDDHGAGRLRNAWEIEPRKASRRHQAGDQPLHNLDRQLTRRHQRQENDDTECGPLGSVCATVGDGRCDENCGQQANRAEVLWRRVAEEHPFEPDSRSGLPSNAPFEL